MRIVGGNLRGRALATPRSGDVRPTSDRVRESVFNILEHSIADLNLNEARVIDVFAGTGALGVEALSRGARFCLFIEQAPDARALIRTNIETFGLTGVSKIFRRDATNLGPSGTMAPFDLAFLDPPYGKALGEAGLSALRDGSWLAPGASVVLEEHAKSTIGSVNGYETIDTRSYGDTQVQIYRFAGQ